MPAGFAVLENTVITGALTKAAAATVAAQLIPRRLHDAIVWIKL
jgi:hypothetical protein